MIKGSSYRCASADAPAEASLICCQEGCTVYPFLCGSPKCACMTLHRKHYCQPLQGLLEEMALPPKLPADLAKEEKDIDSLIDRLVGELQSLKKRHKEHVEKHTLGSRKYTGLLQRLLHGEQLHNKEATGDAIGKMVAEASQVGNVKSPYRVAGEQLRNELRAAEATARQLLGFVEQLWVPGQVTVTPVVNTIGNAGASSSIQVCELNEAQGHRSDREQHQGERYLCWI